MTIDETGAENVKGGASDYILRIDGIAGESSDCNKAEYDLEQQIKA